MPRSVVVGSVFSALLIALTASCGARTGLLTAALCRSPGETRPCADACGDGIETCTDGGWSACEVPEVVLPCQSVCGPGVETCRDGAWRACTAPLPRPPQLAAVVRDFSPLTHPDFEASYTSGLDVGIVKTTLGSDDKPQYTIRPRTKSTSGALNFDQWFRDADVNQSASLELQLAPSSSDAALFVYDNRAFFPIDGELWGNEGRAHNFHFTLEASTTFQYVGGEQFSFSGDDDMWVFVNRQLVIDLGGLHPSLSAEVSLDDVAERTGLQLGQIYQLHFFFAERHTDASNFTIRTTIAEPGSCE